MSGEQTASRREATRTAYAFLREGPGSQVGEGADFEQVGLLERLVTADEKDDSTQEALLGE